MSCERRLQWVVHAGAKRGLRKPNHEEVEQAKVGFSISFLALKWTALLLYNLQ